MLKIRWHGHACFEIGNDKTLVIDPHDGKAIGIKVPQTDADIILITHDHYDHNSYKTVEKKGTKIIWGGNRTIGGIKIQSVKAYHDEEGGKKRGEMNLFKVMIEEMKLCHLGDLGHTLDEATLRKLENIDILFIPIGGTFTIDAHQALETIDALSPKVVIPMHYKIGGLSLPIERIDTFLCLAEKKYGIQHVDNEIEMNDEDFPAETEIWVFSL
jgi:L-ascorbate metabolism protein UlaG (beta-lactamase superfamily)